MVKAIELRQLRFSIKDNRVFLLVVINAVYEVNHQQGYLVGVVDVLLFMSALERQRRAHDLEQAVCQAVSQGFADLRRRVAAELGELRDAQLNAPGWLAVFSQRANNTNPGFEVMIHIQSRTGDFNV